MNDSLYGCFFFLHTALHFFHLMLGILLLCIFFFSCVHTLSVPCSSWRCLGYPGRLHNFPWCAQVEYYKTLLLVSRQKICQMMCLDVSARLTDMKKQTPMPKNNTKQQEAQAYNCLRTRGKTGTPKRKKSDQQKPIPEKQQNQY